MRPRIHHRRPIGDVAHDVEIVGDDQDGDAVAPLQIVQEVQHLALHRNVEARRRLVGDDQLRAKRQRPRNADPARLSAGELVRIALSDRRRQSDIRQQPRNLRLDVVCPAVHPERLGQYRAHAEPRAERTDRILEDHAHVASSRLQAHAQEAR